MACAPTKDTLLVQYCSRCLLIVEITEERLTGRYHPTSRRGSKESTAGKQIRTIDRHTQRRAVIMDTDAA